MEVKITVFRSTKMFLENKPCFKESIKVIDDFFYAGIIRTFKAIYGDNAIITFYVS